jgi:N utilization substance protein A
MKNEFTLAFNEVLEEKQLPKEIILNALELAMVSAYRRAVNASTAQQVEARIDPESGRVLIYAEKEIVESVQDVRTEVSLEDAKKVDPTAEMGGMVMVETTPKDFGRVAAQTARQVIQQRIREAERNAQMAHFNLLAGEIVSGVVQAINASGFTIGLDMKAEGILARKETIPGERFHVHERIRALISEVKDGPRGPQIMMSRAHKNFLRRLLENEVPEIYHGVVEIRSIAREPGERAKVAVAAMQQGIDPVGACVGVKGVRIQAIVKELHDEKIDVIEWNPDQAAYIAKAISPARVLGVYLYERAHETKTAVVVVSEDQLSLAIGRDGQNARLAAKLTGWRIDIKSLPEAAADTLQRLHTDALMAAVVENEASNIGRVEELLQRKADNRILTPEEYDFLVRFVDRVEKRSTVRIQAEKKAEEDQLQAQRGAIPAEVFSRSILDSGLSEHICYILQEAGYSTIGELFVQINADADKVFALQGIGPKAMNEINAFITHLRGYEEMMPPADSVLEPVVVVEEVEVPAEVMDVETQAAVEVAPVVEPEIGVPEIVAEELVAEMLPEDEVTAGVSEEKPVDEPETSMDDIFTMKPETMAQFEVPLDDEKTDEKKDKKGKKKKGTWVEIEYDPDRDLTISKKKHKRGGGEWEEWES